MKNINRKNETILTLLKEPQSNQELLFLFLLKVKIIVSVLCAYANKDFRQQNSDQRSNFYFNPKVAYVERLYGEKITRIQEIEILTLGHL